jgi:tRNA (guanine-N7-)-methyltransferase
MERNRFLDIPREIKVEEAEAFADFIKGRTVAVDMGCGHGDFLIEFCKDYPGKLFVGIEISRKRTHKTAHRLAKRGFSNFRVISAPGEIALKLFFPDNSVDELHINFPDPWLRSRQWKNRILKPSFVIDIIRVLKPDGELNFVSDVEEYALYASSLISRFPNFKNAYDTPVKKNIYDSFPTLFYRKMSPLRDINYVKFVKRD